MGMWSLESMVSSESVVRVIDVFVDSLDLEGLGFQIKGKIKNGAPAYRASDLLKLYFYGYMNRVRSSRRLERESKTNVEAMWLLRGQYPVYKTIANFRKDHPKALKEVFSELTKLLKAQGLFDEELVAIDGSKFRGQNSKKNNYNEKKVEQHLNYIDKQIAQYLEELDQLDSEEENEGTVEKRITNSKALDHLSQRKKKYKKLEEQVKAARECGETQVSTTDADARALPKKMNIVEVGYNVLTAAERKNKLITNYEVSNKSDTYALSRLAKGAKKVLSKEQFGVLADKGFDTGIELKACAEEQIRTYVSPKKRVHAKKEVAFNKDQFVYEEDSDCYVCPRGEQLTTNHIWYKKNNGKHRKAYRVKHYKLPFKVCNACPDRLACAGLSNLNNSKGRYIERSEYQEYIDENIERVQLNKELYRKRQQIVEHQYGTIKRQWGYDYTLVKGLEKVSGEFAIIYTCYNLRRAISILGIKQLVRLFLSILNGLITQIRGQMLRFEGLLFNFMLVVFGNNFVRKQ